MITKKLAIVAVICLALGASAGSSVVYKWAQAQESGRLKVALKIKEQERNAALASLKNYYENLPPVEVIRKEVKYVIKKIPYKSECDVSPAEQRVLDYARTGMRHPSSGANESSGVPAPSTDPARIPRATEVRGHADAATKYGKCYAVAKSVELYLKSRAQPQ